MPGDAYVLAGDGLPARQVGIWSAEKLTVVGRYMGIVTGGMSGRWDGLTHVELFPGPGRCVVEETGEEIPGSPLLALGTKKPFDRIVCVEADPVAYEALQRRVDMHERRKTVKLILGDCNEVIDEVLAEIPQRHLALVFIDPEGVKGFEFSTVQHLTGRNTDFIILFPQNMAINRNRDKWRAAPPGETPLDKLVGPNWRQHREPEVQQFMDRLEGLGYLVEGAGINFSNSRGLRLYYLLFASRSATGIKFWRKVTEHPPDAQGRLL
jgi:three-Cys-motif partner protein